MSSNFFFQRQVINHATTVTNKFSPLPLPSVHAKVTHPTYRKKKIARYKGVPVCKVASSFRCQNDRLPSPLPLPLPLAVSKVSRRGIQIFSMKRLRWKKRIRDQLRALSRAGIKHSGVSHGERAIGELAYDEWSC